MIGKRKQGLRLKVLLAFFALLLIGWMPVALEAGSRGSLTLEDGVVVKFGQDAGLAVQSRLRADREVVFTSLYDDEHLGASLSHQIAVAPGHWLGIELLDEATTNPLQIAGLTVRYAAMALGPLSQNVELHGVSLTENVLAIRVVDGASPSFSGVILQNNDIGLDVDRHGVPSISGSDISNNELFAANTQTPGSVIDARGNWWGSASGPFHNTLNPDGSGNPVSDGVDFEPWLSAAPLLDCRVRLADDRYVRSDPLISLFLHCLNADQMRLSERADLSGAEIEPYQQERQFELSPESGTKQIHVEFLSAGGESRQVQLPRPIQFESPWPVVSLTAPAAGSLIEDDVWLEAQADGLNPIAEVRFFVDDVLLGVSTSPPYRVQWQIADYSDGFYTLVAEVLDQQGLDSRDEIDVELVASSDREPPQILDVFYNGEPVLDDMVWRQAGVLSYRVMDEHGEVQSSQVRLHGGNIPGVLRDGDDFQLPIDRHLVADGDTRLLIRASDDSGNIGEASWDIRIQLRDANEPVARDSDYAVEQGQLLLVAAEQGVLSNDDAPLGVDALELISDTLNGELELSQDGGFSYQPNPGFFGSDRFRYRIHSAGFVSEPAEGRLTVTPANRPPVAVDVGYQMAPDDTLTVAAPGVLGNDYDPDGDALFARLLEEPEHGSLQLAADGGFVYQAASGFVGTVSFLYEAVDPDGLADRATVSIIVASDPVAVDDAYSTLENEQLAVAAEWGVLANDQLNGQTVSVELVEDVARGELQLFSDGGFVYTPPDYFNGEVIFRYRLAYADGVSAPATVQMTIIPVNNPPEARQRRYTADYQTELSVPADEGVLINDSDPDDDPLTAHLIDPPRHGQLDLRQDGSFVYLPNTGFIGTDEFAYEARDPDQEASAAVITIDVTPGPMALNDVYFLAVDETLELSAPGVLVNDYHRPQNSPLEAVLVTPPSHGSALLEPDGSLVYQPDPGFQGIDALEYIATTGASDSNLASVTFAVGTTSFPIAQSVDGFEGYQYQRLEVADSVLDNDLEPNGLPMVASYVPGSGRPEQLPVEVNDDGTFSVDPGGFRGDFSFRYVAFNGEQISNEATVSITFHPVNLGVEARDDEYGVVPGETLVVDRFRGVFRNDRNDRHFGNLVATLESPPSHGELQLNYDGTFEYTPASGFTGTDSFIYRATQEAGGESDTATVTLITNTPPVVEPLYLTLVEDTFYDFGELPNPLDNAYDPDGGEVWIDSWGSSYPHCRNFHHRRYIRYCFERDGTLSWENRNHFFGFVTLYYWVTDGTDRTKGEIHVEVTPVPDPPVAEDNHYVVAPDVLADITPEQGVLRNDYDPDKLFEHWGGIDPDTEPTRARLINDANHGQVVLDSDGAFRYQPEPGFSGLDQFVYEAFDGTGLTDQATVHLTVNSPPVAVPDFYELDEDTVLEVAAPGVLANDYDPDGPDAQLRVRRVHQAPCGPCHGELILRPDGSFRYQPDLDYFGEDRFWYQVSDGVAWSGPAEVLLRVHPVEDPPILEPDLYRGDQDSVLVVPPTHGVLANDKQVDGADFWVDAVVQDPDHGAVQMAADGSFVYTPEPMFHGQDGFRYRAINEYGLTAETDVTLIIRHVNSPPVAEPDFYEVMAGERLVVSAANGVLANDHDPDDDPLVVHLVRPPALGSLSLEPDGSFVFDAPGGPSQITSWTYQVRDGKGGVDAALVEMSIINPDSGQPPILNDVSYSFEGEQLLVSASDGVLANDRYVGEHQVELLQAPEKGQLSLNPDGGFQYQLSESGAGVQQFRYGLLGVEDIYATVTLEPISSLPPLEARPSRYTLMGDGVLQVPAPGVLANDDADDARPELHEAPPETHGTLTLQVDGGFQFQPAESFVGQTHFSYRLHRQGERSDPATVTLVIPAAGEPPRGRDAHWRIRPEPGQTQLLTPHPLHSLFEDSEQPEQLALRLSEQPDIPGLSVQLLDDGYLQIQRPNNWEGQFDLYVVADDGHSESEPVRLRISLSTALFADRFES